MGRDGPMINKIAKIGGLLTLVGLEIYLNAADWAFFHV